MCLLRRPPLQHRALIQSEHAILHTDPTVRAGHVASHQYHRPTIHVGEREDASTLAQAAREGDKSKALSHALHTIQGGGKLALMELNARRLYGLWSDSRQERAAAEGGFTDTLQTPSAEQLTIEKEADNISVVAGPDRHGIQC